jgi:hypothetical protein
MLETISDCNVDRAAMPRAQTLNTRTIKARRANPRHLAILFWVYVAQALAGSLIGFIAPFLYFFGVL